MISAIKQLILLTHSANASARMIEEKSLRECLTLNGGLTAAGWRSLMFQQFKSGVIQRVDLGERTMLTLTPQGVAASMTAFPALDTRWRAWQGNWIAVLFQQAPNSDPQFRQLRQELLGLAGLPLSRGIYLVPTVYRWELMVKTEAYARGLAIAPVEQWLRGQPNARAIEFFHLTELAQNYSGISAECTRLLGVKRRSKKRDHQQKMQFLAAFNRFWEVLGDDRGLLPHFLPPAMNSVRVLAQLQTAFDSIFGRDAD